MQKKIPIPSIIVSSLKGGGGKTIVSLGLVRTLIKRNFSVACFKKGPDYIDAAWLAHASNAKCYNLDPHLMDDPTIRRSFSFRTASSDFAIIEGNRGLFDGMDEYGSCSTAALARIIGCPVLLVVDCTKSTRTIAAIIKGCVEFETDLNIIGVILNQIGSSRHEKIISKAVNKYVGIPILGAIPRFKKDPLPMRHLGLTPAFEHEKAQEALDELSETIENNVDINEILKICTDSPAFVDKSVTKHDLYPGSKNQYKGLTIGVIKDKSFQFYYPENLEALKFLGANLKYINSLGDSRLPSIHCLYIGGGFPETNAKILEKNISFKNDLKQAIKNGLPVYAECGGLMYLGEKILWQEQEFKMTGALPIDFQMKRKPVGHGYTKLKIIDHNPFYKQGEILSGHEFHYSLPIIKDPKTLKFSCNVIRGKGFGTKNEGLTYLNVFATYTHCHALGQKEWALKILEAAKKFHLNSAG